MKQWCSKCGKDMEGKKLIPIEERASLKHHYNKLLGCIIWESPLCKKCYKKRKC
jgi:hypothetical protein